MNTLNLSRKLSRNAFIIAGVAFIISACAPEVGSDKWCEQMKEKPKGDWTANDAADFTKHCIL
ncbi:MAG: DUF3012 domain-containing protein [Rhodospirillaceae bacterium]|nr:DUF3012 domain-containing protein [Rhodospirillaceae bacterium]